MKTTLQKSDIDMLHTMCDDDLSFGSEGNVSVRNYEAQDEDISMLGNKYDYNVNEISIMTSRNNQEKPNNYNGTSSMYIYIYVYLCVYVHMYINMYKYTSVCIYTQLYVYVHTYTCLLYR
jgi:hypothetical protein